MTPKTGPRGKKRPGYVIFGSKSTNEPIFFKIGVVGRNIFLRFLVPALLSSLIYTQYVLQGPSTYLKKLWGLHSTNGKCVFIWKGGHDILAYGCKKLLENSDAFVSNLDFPKPTLKSIAQLRLFRAVTF